MEDLKQDIIGALARGYTYPKTSHIVLEPDLIEAMAKEVLKAVAYNKLEWLRDIAPEEKVEVINVSTELNDKIVHQYETDNPYAVGHNKCLKELFANAEKSIGEKI